MEAHLGPVFVVVYYCEKKGEADWERQREEQRGGSRRQKAKQLTARYVYASYAPHL